MINKSPSENSQFIKKITETPTTIKEDSIFPLSSSQITHPSTRGNFTVIGTKRSLGRHSQNPKFKKTKNQSQDHSKSAQLYLYQLVKPTFCNFNQQTSCEQLISLCMENLIDIYPHYIEHENKLYVKKITIKIQALKKKTHKESDKGECSRSTSSKQKQAAAVSLLRFD